MKYKGFYSSSYLVAKTVFLSDPLCVYLTNTAPALTNQTVADLTLIDLTYLKKSENTSFDPKFGVSKTRTGHVYTSITIADNYDPSPMGVIAYGGSVGPFRYIVLGLGPTYSSTSNKLLAYFDYGFSRSLANGQTMTLSFPSNIMYTIQ